MKESDIYLRATNPEQYDLDDLQWDSEAGTEAPRNLFFWDYLKKYSPVWKGKNILDIGAGNGWVLEEAKNAGARSVLGIEPSVRNLELAKKVRPSIPFAHTSLENFDNQGKKYDVILSVMSLPHIEDLEAAFSKMKAMLDENGEILTVVPDFEYFRIPRHDYKIQRETLSEDEYVTAITRSTGTIADIVRKNELYVKAADKAGLSLIEQVPMTPTESYIAKAPKFEKFKDKALSQLLRFK